MDVKPTGWPLGKKFPCSWHAPIINEVALRESGHTPDKKIPSYWNGEIKWLSLADCDRLNKVYIEDTSKTISDQGLRNSSARVLPPGVVVLSRDAGVGQSAITTCSMAVSQHFVAWKCLDELDPKFLYYWLQFIRPEFERVAVGSTIKTIGLSFFDRMRIPVPPIAFQREAGTVLHQCDTMLSRISDLIGYKKALKLAAMGKIFVRDKYPSRPLSSFCEELRDRNNGRLGPDDVMGVVKSIGFQPMRARVRGKGDLARYLIVPPGAFAYNPMRINIGSIALNNCGRDVLVSPDYVVFRPVVGIASTAYVNQLRYSAIWRRFMRRAGAGSVRVRIYFEDLGRLYLPIPALDVQEQIATVLGLMDQEITLLEDQRENYDLYKRGLMSRLLSGELTLPL